PTQVDFHGTGSYGRKVCRSCWRVRRSTRRSSVGIRTEVVSRIGGANTIRVGSGSQHRGVVERSAGGSADLREVAARSTRTALHKVLADGAAAFRAGGPTQVDLRTGSSRSGQAGRSRQSRNSCCNRSDVGVSAEIVGRIGGAHTIAVSRRTEQVAGVVE